MMQATIFVGQTLPWEPRPALFHPGKEAWFALRCVPLREEKAAKDLKDRGVSAFFPVRVQNVTVKGKPLERRTKMLPGYVFAKFPGEPVWHRVMDRDNPECLIRDVIRTSSGAPGRIRPGDIANLRNISDRDEEREEALKARALIKPGDRVHLPSLLGEVADGAGVEVIELVGLKGFKVRLTMFGAEREIVVENVVKVLDE